MDVTRVSLRFDFALRAPLNERVLVLNERVLVLNERVLILNERVLILNERALESLGVIEIGGDEAFGGVGGLGAVRSDE